MVNLYIEGQLIDQYDDESVEIISSVLDVQDITKNTGDYSKSFTIPTSKRNNITFKHWYNATIDGGFDARTRVSGSIDIDGVPFKTGKWLLRGVKMIKGVPDSYQINFFGDTSSLTEIIGNDTLKDLDLSALNHAYNAPNVTTGLTEGLFDNSIIYTPIAQKNYFYSNDSTVGDFPAGATEADDTEKITSYNIGWNSGLGVGMRWSDLRPSVRVLDIVEAVEDRYNGKYQKTVITIISQSVSSGNIKLYLNGVEHLIYLNRQSQQFMANQLAQEINLISGYNAISSGQTVFCSSETKRIEVPTQLDSFQSTGLVASVSTTLGTKDYGLSFSRDFFGTTEFERIYMWLNAETAPVAIGNSGQIVDWTGKDSNNSQTDIDSNISVLYNRDGDLNCKWKIALEVIPSDNTIPYAVGVYDIEREQNNGIILATSTRTGNIEVYLDIDMDDYAGVLPFVGPVPQTSDNAKINFEVISTESLEYSVSLSLKYYNEDGNETFSTNAVAGLNTISSGVEVSKLMPEMKISEFLKSMIQMFKLVLIGDADNGFYVNTLDSYYAQGDWFDVSSYIDRSKFDINRGEIISELSFKFEDPTTKGGLKFLENNGVAYGDSEVKLRNLEGEDLDGDSLEVSLPYENVVYNRLSNYSTGARTDIQVGTILDLDENAVLNKPLLHYATLIDISDSGSYIKFRGDSSSAQRLDTDMWMPFSHFGVNEPAYSLLYESEISTYTYSKIKNTLYSRHYEDYIRAIYNVKRRTTNVTAKLPIQIITRLSMNDVISIDGLDYRMNKYSYNLLTGMTKLELINGFEQYNVTDLYIPARISIGLNAEDLYFNVPNVSNYTVTKISRGSGTAFITTSIEGTGDNLIKIAVDEWVSAGSSGLAPTNTNPFRYMSVKFTNNTTLAETLILITQTPNNVN